MPVSASRKNASETGANGECVVQAVIWMAAALAAIAPPPTTTAPDLPVPGGPVDTGRLPAAARLGEGLKSGTGITVAVPTGKLWVGQPSTQSQPVYVRRIKGAEGITVVEVSTTPFAPLVAQGGTGSARIVLKPDQPAGW